MPRVSSQHRSRIICRSAAALSAVSISPGPSQVRRAQLVRGSAVTPPRAAPLRLPVDRRELVGLQGRGGSGKKGRVL